MFIFLRSNTSILAQKKKNQKKKASRMRAIVRRHSEGSESEKIDEDFDEKVRGVWLIYIEIYMVYDMITCCFEFNLIIQM